MSDSIQGAAPVAAESPVSENTESQETLESADEASDGAAEESVAELKQDLKDPKLSKSEKKAIEKQLKKYELTVNGKKVTRELDLSDDESVKRYLQKAEASDEKFQESAALRKQVEQFIQLFQKDPGKGMSQLGLDPKKFAEEFINREIENSQKSPEALEKERLQAELEEIKDRYKREEEERKASEFSRLQAETEQKLESDISSALDTGTLPKTPYTVKKMAEMMMIALQNDIDLSPKDVLPLIRKQMQQEIKDLFGASSDDVLEEMLGKDTIGRIRKRNIARAKAAAGTTTGIKPTVGAIKKAEPPKELKKISMKEFLKGNF